MLLITVQVVWIAAGKRNCWRFCWRKKMDTHEKKEIYRAKIEAQLDEWGARIDQLKAKAKQADADMRIKLDEQIQSLKKRREDLRGRLDELKKSSGDAWHSISEGIDHAMDDLKGAWEEARKKFK